jgi:hypothetical protein
MPVSSGSFSSNSVVGFSLQASKKTEVVNSIAKVKNRIITGAKK